MPKAMLSSTWTGAEILQLGSYELTTLVLVEVQPAAKVANLGAALRLEFQGASVSQ